MQNIVSGLIFGGAAIVVAGLLMGNGRVVSAGVGIACFGGGALIFVR